jgi:hypothetical protein
LRLRSSCPREANRHLEADIAANCGKPAFLRPFRNETAKTCVFPAFLTAFVLRYQYALAIVPSGPDFRCKQKGRLRGWPPKP